MKSLLLLVICAQLAWAQHPGSAATRGCGDDLWKFVYNPQRLTVLKACTTVRGTIVLIRKEADGDTHGWLKLDSPYEKLLNDGNREKQGGNLVFEVICHYKITQKNAAHSCQPYADSVYVPPIGSRVSITGTLVRDENHSHWIEIHPVSKIRMLIIR